ncbi:uncharacterized protein MONOS_4767 [Monocercomonoides exilis]|uniref:uncharacterized protein n=1 Tax=Monocercomonoides exilis TaxID=2049356 RepID=UPI00355A5B46|nr:hypothetical protein MONOS_4767 [Monocercomonoides exilis]|eukprot:MONOS_4767.1-p1 / transcript=MONOS_4767.1 / gene=MONOS_4767 / organism=Monocercomonoides_exilis_PA203 / gene_product=unspecified product / transcript_product=unspecified product / location=Mono_scaffold00131:44548-45975(-) / protein_length=411 / sequence_SO=supercontig / SO=protein_coding / is_pseudo=false
MEIRDEDKSNDDVQGPSLANKFSKMFSELEHCTESEQKAKIEEMNGLVEEMNKKELRTILLLKHVGYCNVLKNVWNPCFDSSSLGERFQKITEEEEKKEKEKNEKLLTDIYECNLLFYSGVPSSELLSICIPDLLKVALKKEESEAKQKEVEIALLDLSRIGKFYEIEKELYLKEITEIIKHQQKHRNLTKLAYQSAWQFFIYRFYNNGFLEDTITNELHFGREAARELEELTRNVNWKKKEEEMSKEEAKEELALMRWVETCAIYFQSCRLKNKDNVGLLKNIVRIYQAAKDNCRDIIDYCTYPLRNASENRVVKVEDLLNGEAVDTVLVEIQRQTLNERAVYNCLGFFENVSKRLKEKEDDEMEEVNRKATKRKMLEKMEEEGYEDTIASFHKAFRSFFKKNIELIYL